MHLFSTRCRLKTTGLCFTLMHLLLLSVLSGCAGNRMALKVQSGYDTNEQQPVALVVRAVNYNTFVTESYQDVVQNVYADPPDPTMLDARILLPGQEAEIVFEKPAKDLVGIYCLFSRPRIWKEVIRRPFKNKYRVILRQNDMLMDKRGFWGRLFGRDLPE